MAVEVVIRAEAAEASRVVDEFRGRLGGLRASTAGANEEIRRGRQVFQGFTSVLSAVSLASGLLGQEQTQLAKTFDTVQVAVFTAATAMRGLQFLLTSLGGPVTLLVTAVGALTAAFFAMRRGADTASEGLLRVAAQAQAARDAFVAAGRRENFEAAIRSGEEWFDRQMALAGAIDDTAARQRRQIAIIRQAVEMYTNLALTLATTSAEKRQLIDRIASLRNSLVGLGADLRGTAQDIAEARIAALFQLEADAIVRFNVWQRQQWETAAALRKRLFEEEARAREKALAEEIAGIRRLAQLRAEDAAAELLRLAELEEEKRRARQEEEAVEIAGLRRLAQMRAEDAAAELLRIAELEEAQRGRLDAMTTSWEEAMEAAERRGQDFLSAFLQGTLNLVDVWRAVVRLIADQWAQTIRLMIVQQHSFEAAAKLSFGNIQNAALAAFALVANFAVGKKKRAAEEARRAAAEQARKVEELLREVAQVAQGALQAAFSSNVFFTMERAWEQFTLRLRQDLFRRIQEGIIQALLRTAVLQAAMQPLIQALQQSIEEVMATGVFDPAKFAARLGPAINLFNAMIGRLQPIFAAAFALLRQIGFGLGVFAGPNPFAKMGFPPMPGPPPLPPPGPPPLPPPGPPFGPRDWERPDFRGGQMVVVEAINLNGPMMASDAEARFFARQIMRLIRQEAARA